jgi:hypothetical protein
VALIVSLWVIVPNGQAKDSVLKPIDPSQIEETQKSPRTQLGRRNLQYEYDLHPANAFQHLGIVQKQEERHKRKRRLKLFMDLKIFEDEI